MSIAIAGRIIVLLCWACGTGNGCRAQAPHSGSVIEQSLQSYVVNRDGSYTLTVDEVRAIVQPRAVAAHGQHGIAYNRSLDRLLDVAAYTRKPDGRRLAVGPDQISDRALPGPAAMPTDMRVRMVNFPSVAAGDKLVLHYVIQRPRALFPGHFDDLSSSGFDLNRQFILSYDMPAGMTLHADAVGFREIATPQTPGRKRYRWQYVPGKNRRIDASSVSYLDEGKRMAVSTFADYGEFALAFRDRHQELTEPAIEALAARLAADLPSPRSKVLVLANWVRQHVRHVGVQIGTGAVVHDAASAVLARRHGDSIDHGNLLTALLQAAGIDSSVALVNGENAYRLPRTPTLGILNHMIVYVPSLDLFLDTTSTSSAAGYLPPQILGKPTLLIASGQLARTPAFQLESSNNRIEFQINKSGASRFRVIKTSSGALAEPYRQAMREARPAERDSMVARMLRANGQQGDGIVDAGRLDDDGDRYQMVFAGISERFANWPGPTGLATSFNFWGGLPDSVAALTQAQARNQDFICHGFDRADDIIFEFAPGVQILALPKPLALRATGLVYRADYLRQGNSVTVRRQVQFSPAAVVCSALDYQRWQPLLEQMRRDLKSQIVVRAL
jgi:hypothetical protein